MDGLYGCFYFSSPKSLTLVCVMSLPTHFFPCPYFHFSLITPFFFLNKIHKELIAGNSERSDQNYKLLKVHFTVSVFIQVLHDLLNHFGIISALKERCRWFLSFLPFFFFFFAIMDTWVTVFRLWKICIQGVKCQINLIKKRTELQRASLKTLNLELLNSNIFGISSV